MLQLRISLLTLRPKVFFVRANRSRALKTSFRPAGASECLRVFSCTRLDCSSFVARSARPTLNDLPKGRHERQDATNAGSSRRDKAPLNRRTAQNGPPGAKIREIGWLSSCRCASCLQCRTT